MAKYQQYNEYKDSGVEWSEKIPTHWKTASLSKLFMIKAGGDLQSALFSETKTLEHKHPIYTNANDSKAVYGYTKKPNFPSNTITVSGRGEVGFAVYRNHEFDAIIRLLVLIPFIKLDGRFFAYFINEVIDFNVQSSAIGQLSTLQISPYKVAIPPYQEQSLISDYLDHETAQIDTLIEKQQTLIQLLKEKRQAVISHAVTKGLNPDAPMKDSGVEWLGEVPEHWEVMKGAFIGQLFGSESVPENQVVKEGILPFIKVSTLSRDGFELQEPEWFVSARVAKNYKTRISYVVFPKRGAAIFTNKVNVVNEPSLIDPNLMGWQINEKALSKYIALLLKTRKLDDIADVSTVPQINNKHINPEKFPLPPIKEQQEILDYIDGRLITFDDLIDKAEQAIQLMQERRTALISAAVTGKIDVRGWRASE